MSYSLKDDPYAPWVIVLGLFLFPPASFLIPITYDGWRLFVWACRRMCGMAADAQRRIEDRAERRRRSEEAERRRSAAIEEQKRTQATARQKQTERRRSDDVRAACELLFHRHAPILSSRFAKASFDDFVQKYADARDTRSYVDIGVDRVLK